MSKAILALDAGTTSCRSIIYDENAMILSSAQQEFKQYFPKPAWVEHDPNEIFSVQLETIRDAISKIDLPIESISAIGITNQRETTVLWDRISGEPIYPAIVWQCRRTAAICEELKNDTEFAQTVTEKTGLIIDAYFSATKIMWILDNVPGARKSAEEGNILFGTIDTWLIYKLSKGKYHITDYSNASRTMLFDIDKMCWSEEICKHLDIPMSILPQVVDSSGINAWVDESLFGRKIPIAGIAGDQQSALFGQGCFSQGDAKNTYGTGCFLLMNTGDERVQSNNGLISTIAWGIDGKITYALEGSVFIAGAIMQWLRDKLGIIANAADSHDYATSVSDSEGVYVVPAFSGLGAPHWDMQAQGIICGLTSGSTKAHIIRAALESIAFQSYELLEAVQSDSDIILTELMVDGGACKNDFLMQFQADLLDKNVNRPANIESTSMGAAFLAGLAVGIFRSIDDLMTIRKTEKIFTPIISESTRKQMMTGWKNAVKMCMSHQNQQQG